MKLVKNWRDGWKWISVHCMILASIFIQTWIWIPADLKSDLPHKLLPIIASIIMILGIIGRFFDQETNGNNK